MMIMMIEETIIIENIKLVYVRSYNFLIENNKHGEQFLME